MRFNDPYEYQTFYERSLGGTAKSTIMAPGTYSMELAAINLGRLLVTRTRVSVPRIVYHGFPKGLTSISFRTSCDGPPTLINGQESSLYSVTVAPAGSDAFSRSYTELTIGNLCIAPDKLAAAAHALLGFAPTVPPTVRLACPPTHLLARLRRLHDALCDLADNVPDVLAHPEVTNAMEQELLRTMIYCLADHTASETIAHVHRRVPIMRRFQQAIDERPGEPIYLAELCATVGVTERTLRNHCLHYLGVGPHRYLWLRRMNQARSALMMADPITTTVTKVANDHGFWELSRFAVEYRSLYNESPSTTLRNVPNSRPPHASWHELLAQS
jgi:AraC-like DNA-binding protein